MEAVTSPELQSLFRECPRLIRKLSSQEIRGLSTYVEKRIQSDYADLLKNMADLELSRDNAERKLSRTLDMVQRESEKDRSLAEEYKRSFGNIAQVLSNKEVRFEGKYEDLMKELRTLEKDYEILRKSKVSLEEDVQKKDLLIRDLRHEISKLQETIEERANHSELVQEIEKMRREILRLKVDLDLHKREKSTLLRAESRMREYTDMYSDSNLPTESPRSGLTHKALPALEASPSIHANHNNRWALTPAASSHLARSPNTPTSPQYYCSATECRARRDLDECRTQLAKKCQENAYLSHLLAQARASGPENVTVKKLGLDYYEPRVSILDKKNYKTDSTNQTYQAPSSLARSTSARVQHASILRSRPTYR